jgi:hypothetical protein
LPDLSRNTLRRDSAILLGKVSVNEMAVVSLGDDSNGASPTERIKYNIPPIAIKLDQPLDQFLGKRSWMPLSLLLWCLSSVPWWVKTF